MKCLPYGSPEFFSLLLVPMSIVILVIFFHDSCRNSFRIGFWYSDLFMHKFINHTRECKRFFSRRTKNYYFSNYFLYITMIFSLRWYSKNVEKIWRSWSALICGIGAWPTFKVGTVSFPENVNFSWIHTKKKLLP